MWYKFLFICFITLSVRSFGQSGNISGKVLSKSENKGIPGATIRWKSNTAGTLTDPEGYFSIQYSTRKDTLVCSCIGFETKYFPVSSIDWEGDVIVILEELATSLSEVVISTGYQSVSKERLTGSFSVVNSELLNRSMGPNVLSRLEGVTSSLQFEFPATRGAPSQSPQLRIRGISTLNGPASPLIVVDNFPFEGDINNLNPNDILNVTVLKDAAAASIWGAKAGNGVIVITTKKAGQTQYPKVSFHSALNAVAKPDLFYDRSFLPSADYIALEKLLYKRGNYARNDWTALTPVVETLIAADEGKLSHAEAERILSELSDIDIREQARNLLYRKGVQQQYSVNINGGNEYNNYYISLGYDKNLASNIGDEYTRNTVLLKHELKLSPKLSLSNSVNFVMSRSLNNGLDLIDIGPANLNHVYTYATLRSNEGVPLAIPRLYRTPYILAQEEAGLLNWEYKPLDEVKFANNSIKGDEIRVNTRLNYSISKFLDLDLLYQFQNQRNSIRKLYTEQSYFTRNLINRYTQSDLSRPIPTGGILDKSVNSFSSHYLRMQLNYHGQWNNKSTFSGLAGAEVRQEKRINEGQFRLYGYSDDFLTFVNTINHNSSWRLRPNGSGTIPSGLSGGTDFLDRFISAYSNLVYTFHSKYVLSASIRWDGSNIFGVDFNQKGVPLWSVGGAWNIDKELKGNTEVITQLKARLTYGVSGNTLSSLSALPYVRYLPDFLTNLRSGRLGSIGNPQLRWEKVRTLNGGIDYGFLRNRISGSLDIYSKKGLDLIGPDDFDPTTGIIWTGTGYNMDNNRNHAAMTTFGIDLELNTLNLATTNGFRWETVVLAHFLQNKVTKYYGAGGRLVTDYLYTNAPPNPGMPRSQIYAIPWHGLDETGAPLVHVNGKLSTDYTSYFAALDLDDLKKLGVSSPPHFGSIRNTFHLKGFSIGFNLLWKMGHMFKRSSINYSGLTSSSKVFHIDYLNRWKNAGDELLTTVPSMPETVNSRRDEAYLASEILFEKADLIRIQDLNLTYRFPDKICRHLKINSITGNLYARNLGLLWTANRHGLDPDVAALYPRQRETGVSVTITF